MEVLPTFAEEFSALHPDVHRGCLTFLRADRLLLQLLL
jgi:hypothetical protein